MVETQELLERAKLAEQAERYDDMAATMRTLAEKCPKFENEERNLLSVAYKNVVGAKRSAWRILSSTEQKFMHEDSVKLKLAKDYKEEIAAELNEVCKEVLELLDKYLIPQNEDVDSKVFYLKMKGDYHRYLAEVADKDHKKSTISDSEEAYNEAFELSKKELSATHPIHLGLALNFSVFYYEIANKPEKACDLAKDAYDKAYEDVQSSQNPEPFKDSTLIMHLLRDNLTLWMSDAQVEACGEGGEQQQEEEDLNN